MIELIGTIFPILIIGLTLKDLIALPEKDLDGRLLGIALMTLAVINLIAIVKF